MPALARPGTARRVRLPGELGDPVCGALRVLRASARGRSARSRRPDSSRRRRRRRSTRPACRRRRRRARGGAPRSRRRSTPRAPAARRRARRRACSPRGPPRRRRRAGCRASPGRRARNSRDVRLVLEGRHGGVLDEGGRAGVDVRLHLAEEGDELLVARDPADAPARHGAALRHREERRGCLPSATSIRDGGGSSPK